jgi:HPt (histidine-containing phosphotransfer) domain-containing protein
MDKHISSLGPDLPSSEAELFKLNQYPVFDEKDGLEKAINKSLLQEVLLTTIQDVLPTEIKNMNTAHQLNDWNSIQKIAHKLKGGSLYCGTIRMTYACQYLERYWKAGHRKLLEELYQQLLVVLEETDQKIKSWLK